MNTSAVRFEGVEKRYPHFVLTDVSFDVPPGSIVGFVGPNGAGKSTTMRILMGLVHQDQGDVRVLGHAMPAEQAKAKWDIGFTSEDMRLYGYATLAWHMKFIASIYPAWDPAYAERLLQRFDLHAEQKTKRLSHGERVKAMLLLVLARRPRLMVLDEATTGLDPVARHELLRELMEVLEDTDRTICSRPTTRTTWSRSLITSSSSTAAESSIRATRRRSSNAGSASGSRFPRT